MRFFPISLLLCILWISSANPVIADSETHRFTILHTNDEHGSLMPHPLVDYAEHQQDPTRGGFARLATKVDSIRSAKNEQNESVFVLSGGDIMGGFPFSFLVQTGKAPELHLMQEIGYDIITIGNHEFDYGPEKLATYLQARGYPDAHDQTIFMGSNTYPPEDHPLAEMNIKRNSVFETETGLQVGFLGLLGRGAEQSATLTDPLEFTDPIEEARDQAALLEEAGADLIIAVTHSGITEDRELARKVDAVDLIVGGHSHDALYEPIIENNTPIVQSGYYLQYLGQLDLEFDKSTGQLSILNEAHDLPFLHEIDSETPEDPEIKSLVDAYTDTLNTYLSDWSDGDFEQIDEIIAESEFQLSRSPGMEENQLGNFVTDAMRLQTAELTGEPVDFAFQADGAIREHLKSGTMPWSENELMLHDVISTVGLGSGYDNVAGYPMVSAYLTGEEIRRVMEVSLLLSELFGTSYFLQASGLRMEYNHDRAIFMTIPFLDTPIPSNRGVMKLERYTGDGAQFDDDFTEIPRGEEDQLYRIVADYYIASFLPLVGEIVPQLDITLKDSDGNPLAVEDAIISLDDDRELKMWETVVNYTRSFGDEGVTLPTQYESTGQRLIEVQVTPLWVWALLLFVLIIIGLFYGIRKFRAIRNSNR